jgi:hypothetical protein
MSNKSSLSLFTDLPTKSSKALAEIFEHGNLASVRNDAIENVQSERQREMEMLLNRWNKNKQVASSRNCDPNVESPRNRTVLLDTKKKQVTYIYIYIYYIKKVKLSP